MASEIDVETFTDRYRFVESKNLKWIYSLDEHGPFKMKGVIYRLMNLFESPRNDFIEKILARKLPSLPGQNRRLARIKKIAARKEYRRIFDEIQAEYRLFLRENNYSSVDIFARRGFVYPCLVGHEIIKLSSAKRLFLRWLIDSEAIHLIHQWIEPQLDLF